MSTDTLPQLPGTTHNGEEIDCADEISYQSSELSSAPSSPQLPPGFYPSPPSSQNLDDSALSLNEEPSTKDQMDDAPPARKRRKVDPKPRTTQYLDLTLGADSATSDQKAPLDLLLKTIRSRQKIVVIAGAGISVSAGIPDFRSSDGLFSTLKKDHKLKTSGKQLFDASVYHDDSSTSSFHDMVRSLSGMAASAQPSAFHHLLARLSEKERLLRLYTQNVDGIDTSLPPLATEVPLRVKAPWPRTIQLHGGLEKMVCQKCRHTSNFEAELFDGPNPPLCKECSTNEQVRKAAGQRSHGVGKLRPRIVLYNEHNPDEEAIGSVVMSDLRSRPDTLIVVGTSLKIPSVRRIVREMCRAVRSRKNGVTIWINHDSVPIGKEFEGCWDLVIKGECDEVARRVGMKNWDDASEDIYDDRSTPDPKPTKQIPSVVIRTPHKQQKLSDNGILTPSSSQDEGPHKAHEIPPPVKATAFKNPASNGRSLTDIMDNPKKRQRPAGKNTVASKKPKPKPKKEQSSKITNKFNASKPKNSNASVGKKAMPRGKSDSTEPMHPISPGAARNNGPTSTASKGGSSPEYPSQKGDTISPTRVPPSIQVILN